MDIRVPRKKPQQPPPAATTNNEAESSPSFLLRVLDTLSLDSQHEDTIAVENVWKKGTALTTQSVPSVSQVTAFVSQMFVLHFRKVDHHDYLNWDFRAPEHRRINKPRLLTVLPPPLPAMLKYGAVRKCIEDYFDLNLTHMSSAVRKLVCAVHARMFELKLVRDEDLQFQTENDNAALPPPSSSPSQPPQQHPSQNASSSSSSQQRSSNAANNNTSPGGGGGSGGGGGGGGGGGSGGGTATGGSQPPSTWYDSRIARRREAELLLQQQQQQQDDNGRGSSSSSSKPSSNNDGVRRSPGDRRGGGPPPTIEPRRSVWEDRRQRMMGGPSSSSASASGGSTHNKNDPLGGGGGGMASTSEDDGRRPPIKRSKMNLGVLDGTVPSGTRVIGDKRETSFAGLGVKRVVRNGHNGWVATFELDDDDLSDDEVPERRNIITTKRVEFTPAQYGSEDAAKIAAEAFVFKVEKGCQTDTTTTATSNSDDRPPSSRVKREAKPQLSTAANWRPNPIWNPIAHCSTCSCTDSTDIHCRTCCCSKWKNTSNNGPSRRQIRNGPDLITKVALRRASPYWDSWFETLWRSSPAAAAAPPDSSAASSTTFPSFDLLTTQVSTADIDNALLN